MKIDRAELLEILNKLRPGLAKRETIEQATHFIFTGEEVVTFNDQICIHYPFKTDFQFSVKADEFYKIISTLPDKHIKLDLDSNIVKLTTQTTKAGLSIVVDESHQVTSLISMLLDDIGKWLKLPSDFIQGAYLCLFSASQDAQKGPLVCISVDGATLQSCDNYRASAYRLDGTENYMAPFLIHARDATELVKFPEINKYAITNNWAHFKSKDEVMFSARKFWDEYVDISAIFDYDVDNSVEITLPKGLKEVVSSCGIMAEGEIDVDRFITVSFKDGWITCFSKKTSGWMEKTIEVDYDGKPFEFKVNPGFFSEILEKVTTMRHTGAEKVIFESDNFLHVLALNVAQEFEEQDEDIPF